MKRIQLLYFLMFFFFLEYSIFCHETELQEKGIKAGSFDYLFEELMESEEIKTAGRYSGINLFKQFKKISSVQIPIKINLIFIGFNGNGNQKININENFIKPWFEHIDHTIPHTFVDTLHPKTESINIDIEYSYTFNVIEMHPMVEDVIEWAINTMKRSEIPQKKRF